MNVYTQTKVLMEHVCGRKLISNSDTKRIFFFFEEWNFKQQNNFVHSPMNHSCITKQHFWNHSCVYTTAVVGPSCQRSIRSRVLQHSGWQLTTVYHNTYYTRQDGCLHYSAQRWSHCSTTNTTLPVQTVNMHSHYSSYWTHTDATPHAIHTAATRWGLSIVYTLYI